MRLLRAEERFSGGLTFVASFNYQKAIGVGYSVNESGPFSSNVPQDPRNLKGDRGRFNLDQRFRFVFSQVWELPVFRHRGGIVGAALGGWAVNGIVQLSSGFPVTVSQSSRKPGNSACRLGSTNPAAATSGSRSLIGQPSRART